MSRKGTPVPQAATALANLDRYMAAAGYNVDHPWRAEIASVGPVVPADCDNERARLFSDIDDACDNIADSHSIIIGLVKSALHQVVNEGPGDPKLEAAMRATLRYQHDIDSACAKIIDTTSRLVEIEQIGGEA
jgi:hypothetical protein